MAEESVTLENLKEAMEDNAVAAQREGEVPAEPDSSANGALVGARANEALLHVQKLDDQGRSYATGKRKDAVARIWIKPGAGRITVNGREVERYFARPVLRMLINQPFDVAGRAGQYDVMCTVKGGGLSGQAGAVRHDPL